MKVLPDKGYGPFEITRKLKDGEIIDTAGGLKVIHTPGHTDGHISLLHLESETLITGDSILGLDNTKTIYSDLVSGRAVQVGSSASTLGTSASSRRFKENIVDAEFDIQDVYALRPVKFDYNDLVSAETDEYKYNQFGLIAEEVAETSLSFLVSHDDSGLPRHIKYELLAVALVSALKEQNERIAALETRITALENN